MTIAADILEAWNSESDQYARKKKDNPFQPMLFQTQEQGKLEGLGPGHWITIGAKETDKDPDGHHGGHHVFMGDDGKMKTGAFKGMTPKEAFGDRQKQKRITKRGQKHEHGQAGLFETETQPTLPGVGPGNYIPMGQEVEQSKPKPKPKAMTADQIRDFWNNYPTKKPEAPKAEPPAQAEPQAGAVSPQDVLNQAAPYRQYGKDYNRNIADPAARLEKAIRDGHSPQMLNHLAGELKQRLDHWGSKKPEAEPVDNRSEQQKSIDEFTENFNRVSANPEAAKSRDLHRADSYLEGQARSFGRKLQRGEITQEQHDNLVSAIRSEQDWYKRLLKERGDYSGPPYSDEKADPDVEAVKKMAPGAKKRIEREQAGRESQLNDLEAKNRWAENHIKIAADDISKLRKSDVYRVLDNAPPDKLGYLENWIIKRRPDLAQEVNEASQDIHDERAASKPVEPKPGIEMPKPRTNEGAQTGDQLGVFGDTANVKREGKPKLNVSSESRGKQSALFDTKGDKDQMLMFDDGVTPEDRIGKVDQSEGDKIPGGKADGKSDSAFKPMLLEQGKQVESEHTSDPATAKEIAKDHLAEDPKYYDKLAEMEGKEEPKSETGHSALDWMKSKASPMKSVTESMAETPKDLENTGIFEGRVPSHMRQNLKTWAEERATRKWDDKGTGGGLNYNVKGDDGKNYTLSLNAKSGQARLTFDHREDETPKEGGSALDAVAKALGKTPEQIKQENAEKDKRAKLDSLLDKKAELNKQGASSRSNIVSKQRKMADLDERISQERSKGKTDGKHDLSTLDGYKAFMNKVDKGEVSAADLQAAHKQFSENKEAIRAELSKMKKDEINAWHHEDGIMAYSPYADRDTKDKAIDRALQRLEGEFNKSTDSISYNPFGGGSYEDSVRKAIGETTDEHLKAHAEQHAKQVAERQKKKQEFQDSLDNPKTAHDWARKSRLAGGYDKLKPHEQAAYDDALASYRREKYPSKPQKATEISGFKAGSDATGSVGIVEGHHQKRNQPTYTVTVENHLGDNWKEALSRAKQMGGNYVNARIAKAYGATPGFQFFDKDKAEAFKKVLGGESHDISDSVKQQEEERRQRQTESLLERAERIESRGEGKLNAPRKDNTARRARIARGMEDDARKEIAKAKTLRQVADHIESGKAKHLHGVKAARHLDELDTQLYHAKSAAIRAERDAAGKKRSWDEEERRWDSPAKAEDIAHAKFPFPRIHRMDMDRAQTVLERTPGLKNLAKKIGKWKREAIGTDGGWKDVTDGKDLEALQSALPKMRRHSDHAVRAVAETLGNRMDSYNRLHSMDITNTPELRAALREYHALKSNPEGPDPIKEKIRDLKRDKTPGFFPTPSGLAAKVVEHAQIEDGHSVLEPSAGIGNLMDTVKEMHPDAKLHGIEQKFDFADVLKMKGHSHEVGDFLQHDKKYDRIVMNPPFENRQDEKHVQHAYSLLNPGGRMVAITSAGPHQNERSAKFRDWLSEVGAKVIDLDEGQFMTDDAIKQTGVNTKLVVIEKKGDKQSAEKYSQKFSRAFVPVLLAVGS